MNTHTANPSHRIADRVAAGAAWVVAALVVGLFAWIVGDVLWHGVGSVSWSFLSERPADAGRAGGVLPIIVSTGLILAVCMAASIPLGVGTAVLLAEFASDDRLFGRLVRRSLDVLAGVPSIVFGLFGNALFCVYLGMGYSILAGGLTLACMVLPLLTRAAEEGLRSVPDDYRQAAAALGMSRASTLWRVVLPVAAPGIGAGLVLGIGRALAETAALLFTAGSVDRMPTSLTDSGRALSVHIYTMAMNVAGGDSHAYGSAVVLLGMLIAINIAATRLTAGLLRGRRVTA